MSDKCQILSSALWSRTQQLLKNRSLSTVLGSSRREKNQINSDLRWIFAKKKGTFHACVMSARIFSTIRITKILMSPFGNAVQSRCILMHLNGTQWGMESSERDFDTACEKFITAAVTHCPVPEVICTLRAFAIIRTAALWEGDFILNV